MPIKRKKEEASPALAVDTPPTRMWATQKDEHNRSGWDNETWMFTTSEQTAKHWASFSTTPVYEINGEANLVMTLLVRDGEA